MPEGGFQLLGPIHSLFPCSLYELYFHRVWLLKVLTVAVATGTSVPQ